MYTIPTANTDTHDIEARYEMHDGLDAFEINTKGYTLEEITADMIEFFSDMYEAATKFELVNVINQYDGDNGARIEIKGDFYNEDEPNQLDAVTVIIEASEK